MNPLNTASHGGREGDLLQKLATPIIYEVDYSEDAAEKLQHLISEEAEKKYLLRYPTFYLLNEQEKEQIMSSMLVRPRIRAADTDI